MSLPPPRPPGPAFAPQSRGPTIWSLTFRMAIGATLVSVVLIALQASQLRSKPRPPAEPPGGSAEPVTGTALPAGATSTAGVPPSRDPRQVQFHGLLESVTDFDDIAQNRAYAAVADYTRRLTDEESGRIVRSDVGYADLVKSPGAWRGEYVRLDGLLIKLDPVRLVPGAGPPGVEDAWRGWLMEPGGDECFVFDLVGDPTQVSKRDLVRIEGTFLKIIRYENQRGQARDAPFLVARRAWTLAEEEVERPFRYDYVVVVGIMVIGIVMVIMRKQAADQQTLLESKRAELARKLKKRTDNA